MKKQPFGRRINAWLAEPKGEIFRDGKWRFWFPTLIGLTALNAVMTAVIFGQDGAQKYIGSIVVLAGAVLCWLALGLLHYSDSEDRTLAIGVAALDSASLLFVAIHFAFLLWCQGHLWNLRAAERQYREDMATYNKQWQPIKESNDQIAATAERIAQIEKQTERIRNDTAYWSRKNGVKPPESGLKVQLSTSNIDIPPPPKEPAENSAAFLGEWDRLIRISGFGELGLSIITLIFVRTRTATRNRIAPCEEDFPDELDVDMIKKRSPTKRGEMILKTTTRDDIVDDTDSYQTTTRSKNPPGLKELRECLKLIAFNHPPGHFKADLKPDFPKTPDHVRIRLMGSSHGEEYTTHSIRAKLSLLDDAVAMESGAFKVRLEKFLRENDFYENYESLSQRPESTSLEDRRHD